MTRSMLRKASPYIAGILLLTACGGDGDPASSDSGSAAENGGSDETHDETREFTVGLTLPDVSTVALLAAIDDLRENGYTIDTPEVAEPELLVEGLANGDFDISGEATTAALVGVQQGADVKIIADLTLNTWTLYGNEEVATCADLDGKRLAIHSEGGNSTALVRNYIETECPEAEPTYMIIPGSNNRYAALLAGEIDASPIELSEAIPLEHEGEGRFNLITNFAETLPDVHPLALYGNGGFMEENPTVVTELLAALLEQNRLINDDVDYLMELWDTYLDYDLPHVEEVAERYVSFFPADGGIDEEGVQETIDFGVDATAIEPGLTVDDVADLSYLNAALELVDSR